MNGKQAYAKEVYEFVKEASEYLDAIYEEFIIYTVGHEGLNALLENGLLETCGAIEGRQLYVLKDGRWMDDILKGE